MLLIWASGCSRHLQPYGHGREVGIVYHAVMMEEQGLDEARELGWAQVDSENHFIRNWIRYALSMAGGVGTYLVGDSNDWWSSSGSESPRPSPIVAQPGEETAEAINGGRIDLRGVGTCPDHIRAAGAGSEVFCEERLP